MTRPEKIRLGDLLIQQKLITDKQLQFALDEQKRNGRKLGRVLADSGFVTEEQISETLAKQLHIPYINLKNFAPNLEVVRRLPESQARRFRALVLEERDDVLLVGMADPTDVLAFDELGRTLKRNLDAGVVTEGQLLETIDRVYRRSEEIGGLVRDLSAGLNEQHVDFGIQLESAGVEDTSVGKLLQTTFSDAARARASDIYIEPFDGRVQIRFRVNGKLIQKSDVDAKMVPMLLSRLKLMSGMDASEKRLPQEGGFSMQVSGHGVDVSVATLPTQLGESVAIHLTNQDSSLLVLDKLGMQPDMLRRFREILRRGNGFVLVVGPADSGKNTTLYSVLTEINNVAQKIIAVGHRPGYRLPGIAQVQVNEKIDLTLARILRSVLNHEPDIVLVDEVGDTEAAQIMLRAAMTNCQVFSGLAVRDAASALPSLIDMGVPAYLVASSLQVVLAQHLLRRVCQQCGEAYAPTAQEAEWLKQSGLPQERWGGLRRGHGCSHCDETGYDGRFAVFEMLEMDRALAEAAVQGGAAFLGLARDRMQGGALLDHALEQLEQGATTVAEVMRVQNLLAD